MSKDRAIDYVEFQAAKLGDTKTFFHDVFGWEFEDWGADYCSFSDGNIAGGFRRGPGTSDADSGATLVVLYADDLEEVRQKIIDHGGRIKTDIFDFPGGRRFHFLDPNGNELAVWSEQ